MTINDVFVKKGDYIYPGITKGKVFFENICDFKDVEEYSYNNVFKVEHVDFPLVKIKVNWAGLKFSIINLNEFPNWKVVDKGLTCDNDCN